MRYFVFIAVLLVSALPACRGASRENAFEGTLGDAMIEFIENVEELAGDMTAIDSVGDCRDAESRIEGRVETLRRLHPIVDTFTAETWKEMPQGLIERRDQALRSFNQEAVRVLLDRDRAAVLRHALRDVPSLIYPSRRERG